MALVKIIENKCENDILAWKYPNDVEAIIKVANTEAHRVYNTASYQTACRAVSNSSKVGA